MKRLLLAVVAVSVLPAVVPAVPASATFPGSNGKIAYFSKRAHPDQIFSINPNGLGKQQLTSGSGRGSFDPEWSPSALRIAFVTNGGSGPRLEIMTAGGNNPSAIVDDRGGKYRAFSSPTWSPPGGKIAFCARTSNGSLVILVVNQDGTGLDNISGSHTGDCDPDWAPDGSRIAFDISAGARTSIATMRPDGSGRRVIVSTGDNKVPSWSPDSSRIAFQRRPVSGGRSDIARVSENGSAMKNLTATKKRWEFDPAWAPDGTEIVFARSAGTNVGSVTDLWLVPPSGGGAAQLTTTNGDEYGPSWQAT